MIPRQDKNRTKATAGDRVAENTFAALRAVLGPKLKFTWTQTRFQFTGRIRGPAGATLDMPRAKVQAWINRGWIERAGQDDNVFHYVITTDEES